MDPASIFALIAASTGLVKQLAEVAIGLRAFIKHAPKVQQSVTALVDEVEGLQHALDATTVSLKQPIFEQPATQDSELIWTMLESSVEKCKVVAMQIEVYVAPIKKGSFNVGIIRKAVAQMQLDMDAQDIRDLRAQAQSHKLNILTSLQLLTLNSVAASSAATSTLLEPKLSDLASTVADVKAMLFGRASGGDTSKFATQQAMEDTQTLLDLAPDTLSTTGSFCAEDTYVRDWIDEIATSASHIDEAGVPSSQPGVRVEDVESDPPTTSVLDDHVDRLAQLELETACNPAKSGKSLPGAFIKPYHHQAMKIPILKISVDQHGRRRLHGRSLQVAKEILHKVLTDVTFEKIFWWNSTNFTL